MKTLLWKLRYAIAMRRAALLPWLTCWDFAGSWLEMVNGDLSEAAPADAVAEEISRWDD
jgi:hypothetical protein